MMLARLIQQTEHDYQHVIIALMKTSEVYQSALERCQSHYTLGWNGLNTLSTVSKLRALLKNLQPATVQCWMYHANALTSLSVIGLAKNQRSYGAFIILLLLLKMNQSAPRLPWA